MRLFLGLALVGAGACSAQPPVTSTQAQVSDAGFARIAYLDVRGTKEELALITTASIDAGWQVQPIPKEKPKAGKGWTVYASPPLETVRLVRPMGGDDATMEALLMRLKPVAGSVTIRAYDADGVEVD